MKAERLIELFERVGEAEGAVTSLRALVLDLALRGRLVPQDPTDEPIAKTLREIDRRRARRAGRALVASQRDVDNEEAVGFPHVIPRSWQWVALGEVSDIFMGQSPPGHTYNKRGEGLPLINGPVEFSVGPFGRTVINQFTTEPTVLCDEGDLLVCVRGSTTGRTNVASCHACIGRGVAAIRPYLPDRYLRLVIWRLRDAIIGMGRGIAFPSVSRAQLQALPVPLPPLAEQQRITARVDELMALCDQLESAQAERERRRDRLVTASLQRLREPVKDAAVFREQAAFHLRHMGRMTTTPGDLSELRHSLRSLATRGFLSERQKGDDSVDELLASVARERRIADAGKKGRRIDTARTSDGRAPHAIPTHWRWVRLEDLCVLGPMNGISPKPTDDSSAPKAISLSATTTGEFRDGFYKHVEIDVDDSSPLWLAPGDLLFQRGNTPEYVGIAAVYTGAPRTLLFPDLIIKTRVAECLDVRYVHLAAVAPYARDYLRSMASGAQATMPKISQSVLREMPIPLPPRCEQERIVSRTGELMGLCRLLEQQIADCQTKRARLQDVLFTEVLRGAS